MMNIIKNCAPFILWSIATIILTIICLILLPFIFLLWIIKKKEDIMNQKAVKYRIKIITYGNDRQIYQPQVKTRFGWWGITYDGEAVMFQLECDTREIALKRIDKHFNGNHTIQHTKFEYIYMQNLTDEFTKYL